MTKASSLPNTMPRYYIWTIGCQMNKAESDRLAHLLEERGYQAAAAPDAADIIILNSCVVREHAENRVVNRLHLLRPLKNKLPNVTLALTGCMVDSNIDEMKKEFPHIDHFFKPGEIPSWLEEMEKAACDSECLGTTKPSSVCAFVPIIQGCDQFCTYCIVPYRRGRERSRPVAEIVVEAEELARSGIREITLVGQNVDAYGHDLPDKPDLAGLLEKLEKVDGLFRLRFLTNHPKDMSTRLIDAISRQDKVCEQVNLPVQAGSNDILSAMKRGYSAEQYRHLISEIRLKVPGIALSTDVIVGFPGETAERFEQTVDLLADLKFDAVHIAAYSPRKGTVAARQYTDDVTPAEKKRRLAIIEKMQTEIASGINAALSGRTVAVLVEGKEKDSWYGRTRTNKLVFISKFAGQPGDRVDVLIDRTGPWSLQGKINNGENHERKK
ncbi:MAG: tRNA (N6-isopentenyl adenosine(37)-C2)-methylthiotransferase MiaB [Dehalococcoidales bacterium]|nr:tRNA (N6-isopentenyl adenosine(37)-C2)-methylthiotransferase MiaB [Dehalococcoidales bacterium]